MEGKWENKVALITGASGGIGSALAERLAMLKINLALAGRNEEKLSALREKLKKYGVKIKLFIGSFFDEEYLKNLLSNVVKEMGAVDILINNAGITLNSTLENTSMEDFDKMMYLNSRVPFYLCKESLVYLRKSSYPTIINIASIVGHVGYVNQSAYSASKHALIGLTQSLSREVYKEGIRVHLISPGGVFTDMVRISRPDLTGEDMIMPSDIADIVEFYITHRTNAMIDEIMIRRSTKEPF